MIPPTAYQGGKQRISKQIVDILLQDYQGQPILDICCGSGAVSIELVNSGVLPDKITMVDLSPWGLFWKAIGEGTFDVEYFDSCCKAIPENPREIQQYIKSLSKQPASQDTVYVFLLLQAASFGSKSIWINGDKWMNCSFRNYWEPTATSNRRSHVNPMMPMPTTLVSRAKELASGMKGVMGLCQDAASIEIPPNAIVYADPPYAGTTFYGYDLDVVKWANQAANRCYVSESKPLSNKAIMITSDRKKGGISGERTTKNEEWLSVFN